MIKFKIFNNLRMKFCCMLSSPLGPIRIAPVPIVPVAQYGPEPFIYNGAFMQPDCSLRH